MKKIIFLLFWIITIQIASGKAKSGIVCKGKYLKGYTSIELDARFKHYQVYSINSNKISRYIKSNKYSFFLNLKLSNNYDWKMQLEPNDLRGEKYQDFEISENGIIKNIKQNSITFKGKLANINNSNIRISLDKGVIYGFIFDGNEEIFIEPLSNFTQNKNSNMFVVYRASDVILSGNASCAAIELNYKKSELDSQEEQILSLVCKEFEISTAADYSMFLKYGNTINTNNHILSILNMAEANFSFFDLNFVVNDQYVVNCNGCDPWTTSLDGELLLSSFSAWGQNNFNTHDDGQLWTVRDIHKQLDYNVVGIAYIGGVCNTLKYNIIEDYISNVQNLRVLCAHEIGHNFNAQHDISSGFIMQPSVNPNATTWSTISNSAINSWVSNSLCLGSCSSISNDDCGNSAISLISEITCMNTTNTVTGATSSGISIPTCNGFTSSTALDVWFKFTAVCSDHTVTVNPSGNIIGNNAYLDAVIAVYSSCSNSALIDCEDISGGSGVTTILNFSSLIPGNQYYIRVFDYGTAQPANGEFEICITHSCATTGDDIFITNQQIDVSSIDQGGSINVNCNQNYQGTSTTILNPIVGYYLSSDTIYSNDDYFLGEDLSSINANDLNDPESELLIIPQGISMGSYYVLFIADHTNVITENDESNNKVFIPITITNGGDDIYITSQLLDVTSINAGETFTASCNQNYSGTNVTTIYPIIGYYLSTDDKLSFNDEFLGEDQSSINFNDPDDPESELLQIPIETITGLYYILFVADHTKIISEFDEDNNIEYESLTISNFVGIANQCKSSKIIIYPNPSYEYITIHTKNIQIDEFEITLLNLLGKELFKFKTNISIPLNGARVDLREYVRGVYLLNIRSNNFNETFKVSKQ